ncbi:hypothetical protein EVAR_83706_1 [Eumeta japonica]|uniref:Uncharacterized protein n=1 Tax=Eumeta variegata TaxID=151549 RepID=A0A4C1WD07_EUMVA|nr:hypothetical protein EVAR_83706_1 [Eumeta japonica]
MATPRTRHAERFHRVRLTSVATADSQRKRKRPPDRLHTRAKETNDPDCRHLFFGVRPVEYYRVPFVCGINTEIARRCSCAKIAEQNFQFGIMADASELTYVVVDTK